MKPMKRTILILCGVILSSAILAGCGVKKPIEGRLDPYPYGQIRFADKELSDMTAVGVNGAQRDEAGLLHLHVPIRSASNKQLHVEYRVIWLDQSGAPLNPDAGWMTKTLEPNVQDYIVTNSLTPRATQFELSLRWAEVYRP